MSSALDGQLSALAEAVRLADGRLDPEAVEAARAVGARAGGRGGRGAGGPRGARAGAGGRVGLGLDATVVALAGPTGAGKSTLFNLLAGRELSRSGVRRPTTAATTAAVASGVDDALLDWLDVRSRDALDAGAPAGL